MADSVSAGPTVYEVVGFLDLLAGVLVGEGPQVGGSSGTGISQQKSLAVIICGEREPAEHTTKQMRLGCAGKRGELFHRPSGTGSLLVVSPVVPLADSLHHRVSLRRPSGKKMATVPPHYF